MPDRRAGVHRLGVRPRAHAADIAAEKAAAVGTPAGQGRPARPSRRNVVLGAVGAIGVGLLGLVGVLALGGGKPAQNLTLSEQIQAYGVMAVPGTGRSASRRRRRPRPWRARPGRRPRRRWPTTRTSRPSIATALEAAGLDLRPAEWLLLPRGHRCRSAACVGILIGAGNIVLGHPVRGGRAGRPVDLPQDQAQPSGSRRSATALADTLQLMSGSLSAGLSLAQSIDTIVREGAEPIASEFRRVVVETRLGVTLEDSLEGVAERMESRTSSWVVMAIRIQREVGGNLAELLLTVAATLREREYLRRHVRALSAEGRLSCYILGGLPPGLPGSTSPSPSRTTSSRCTRRPSAGSCVAVMARAARRRHLLDVQGREGGRLMSPVVIVGVRADLRRALPRLRRRRRHLQGEAGVEPLHRRARGAHRRRPTR